MKKEAETLLSQFCIYLAVVFVSVLWKDFTVAYRTSMEAFQYCPVKCYTVEIDASAIESNNNSKSDFAKCGFTDD